MALYSAWEGCPRGHATVSSLRRCWKSAEVFRSAVTDGPFHAAHVTAQLSASRSAFARNMAASGRPRERRGRGPCAVVGGNIAHLADHRKGVFHQQVALKPVGVVNRSAGTWFIPLCTFTKRVHYSYFWGKTAPPARITWNISSVNLPNRGKGGHRRMRQVCPHLPQETALAGKVSPCNSAVRLLASPWKPLFKLTQQSLAISGLFYDWNWQPGTLPWMAAACAVL